MTFCEASILGFMRVLNVDRESAAGLVSFLIADEFFTVAETPDASQLFSFFRIQLASISPCNPFEISSRFLSECSDSLERDPRPQFRLNYFTSALAAMPKPQRR
jgi:hypothetical protein